MKINSIIYYFKKPIVLLEKMSEMKLLCWLPDRVYLSLLYRLIFHRKLNLKNPRTFNEKIQWLKLYDRNPLYPQLADKYSVRKYIADAIGNEYLIPLLGAWDHYDEIDFGILSDQFVLKCNHDSGGIVFCKDKSTFDNKTAKEKIERRLEKNYYWMSREWAYKDIRPRIIAEKYLVDESETAIRDYKFMCFNGQPRCLFVCLNRGSDTGLNVDFYDMQWNPLPFERKYKKSGKILERPESFDKMVQLCEVLAKPFPFIRIDFYSIYGKIYFGELTFYPGAGTEKFQPDEWDEILGSWLTLPDQK